MYGISFGPFYDVINKVLAWFYGLTHNYAIAIALLTTVVMLAVLPLTLKGTKGMLEMQRIQPLVKQLQQQYKGDRQKLNEETMNLYREHKINPLGGCLPLLLQSPVFIFLWRGLLGVTRVCTPSLQSALAKAGQQSCAIDTFYPKHVPLTSELYKSLLGKKQMLSFGLDLSSRASSEIAKSFVIGLPYIILVLVVGGLTYFQQWQISARTTGVAVNPQQQMLMKVIPVFFALISLTFPAGLIIYLLVSNIFRIGQNYYITHRFYGADHAGNAVIDVQSKPTARSNRASKAGLAEPGPNRPTPRGTPGAKPPPSPPAGKKAQPPAPKPSRPKPPQSGSKPRPQPSARPSQNRPKPSRPNSSGRPDPQQP